ALQTSVVGVSDPKCSIREFARTEIPNLWEWAYWLSPLSYVFKSLSNNEFLASRWTSKRSTGNSTNLGFSVLQNLAIPTSGSTYWINDVALLCFVCLFNIVFTGSLMYASAAFAKSSKHTHLLIASATMTWPKSLVARFVPHLTDINDLELVTKNVKQVRVFLGLKRVAFEVLASFGLDLLQSIDFLFSEEC
ncbi:ABC transporter G family member 35-like protein, partial [Tanacetum coccineum]